MPYNVIWPLWLIKDKHMGMKFSLPSWGLEWSRNDPKNAYVDSLLLCLISSNQEKNILWSWRLSESICERWLQPEKYLWDWPGHILLKTNQIEHLLLTIEKRKKKRKKIVKVTLKQLRSDETSGPHFKWEEDSDLLSYSKQLYYRSSPNQR